MTVGSIFGFGSNGSYIPLVYCFFLKKKIEWNENGRWKGILIGTSDYLIWYSIWSGWLNH